MDALIQVADRTVSSVGRRRCPASVLHAAHRTGSRVNKRAAWEKKGEVLPSCSHVGRNSRWPLEADVRLKPRPNVVGNERGSHLALYATRSRVQASEAVDTIGEDKALLARR